MLQNDPAHLTNEVVDRRARIQEAHEADGVPIVLVLVVVADHADRIPPAEHLKHLEVPGELRVAEVVGQRHGRPGMANV